MEDRRTETLAAVERTIGYGFSDRELLDIALTHSSYVKGDGKGTKYNERLEFLGDAVLGFCVGEFLFTHYKQMDEGMMTRVRSLAVRETALYAVAQRLDLGGALLLNRGEELNGGREKPSILADAMEAVIGAVYLDGGMEAAKTLVLQFAEDMITDAVKSVTAKDDKTVLQEYVQQKHMGSLRYDVVGEEGPDHEKTFDICVFLNGKPLGRGSGHTKQDAGQNAAKQALESLGVKR